MEQPDSNKAYYLDMWTEMLWAFLGWPPSTVMEWAREHIYLDQMDDPDDLYYHESPQYWITDLLISESVRGRLSENDHAVLKRRILEAFADEHYHHFPRGTDWRKELLAAALDGVGGLAIALMKLVFGQIRMEANAFGHAPVLQQSRVTRYQRFLMLVDDH